MEKEILGKSKNLLEATVRDATGQADTVKLDGALGLSRTENRSCH